MLELDEKDFCVKRTVRDLWNYEREMDSIVRSDPELLKVANLRRGAFERFLKELRPFAHYCRIKHGFDSDVLCYLSDEAAGDAIVEDPKTGQTRLVELTCPLDGEFLARQKRLRSEGKFPEITIFDISDTSLHKAALERVLAVAEKKRNRDYTNSGGSTLLFVFSYQDIFWDNNESHNQIIRSLIRELGKFSFHADEVEVLLFRDHTVELVPVNGRPL
jgi:hypothetical protein